MIDGASIVQRGCDAELPVTTSVYTLVVVMNEETPNLDDRDARDELAAEFQRALDDGYFTAQRYDALDFEVVSGCRSAL